MFNADDAVAVAPTILVDTVMENSIELARRPKWRKEP
jgi:hypothetical protein